MTLKKLILAKNAPKFAFSAPHSTLDLHKIVFRPLEKSLDLFYEPTQSNICDFADDTTPHVSGYVIESSWAK